MKDTMSALSEGNTNQIQQHKESRLFSFDKKMQRIEITIYISFNAQDG